MSVKRILKKAFLTGAAASIIGLNESKAQNFFYFYYGNPYWFPANNLMWNTPVCLPFAYNYWNFFYSRPYFIYKQENEKKERTEKEPEKLYETRRANFRKMKSGIKAEQKEEKCFSEVGKRVSDIPDVIIPYDKKGNVCKEQYDDIAVRFYDALIRKASIEEPQIAVSDYGRGQINFIIKGPYTAGQITIRDKEIPKINGIVTSENFALYLAEKIEPVWKNLSPYGINKDFRKALEELSIGYFPTHYCKTSLF